MKPPYGEKAHTVRLALLEAPTTSSELTAALGWRRNHAAAWLNVLVQQGHAVADSYVISDQRKHKLYSLTPRGIAACRNYARDTMRAHDTREFSPPVRKVVSRAKGPSTQADRNPTIQPWLNTHSPTWPAV